MRALSFGLTLLLAVSAHAAMMGPVGTDAALREPRRLTAGDSDQFLGSLGPDGRTLVFASNRDAVVGAFRQTLPDGVARSLFDEGADISLPRLSPDGRTLLYISTRDDATGDVCLRTLETGARRCLGGPQTAESSAFWFPDGTSLGVVARGSMHGEQVLRRVWLRGDKAGGVADGEVLVDRSVSTPTVSPDGRWLVYVPVERASTAVGVHFAMQLGRGLHVVRVDAPKRTRTVRVDLPGETGFPAFSPDGRWLYFTQSLRDTNGDGVVDGDDHGVIFRLPFRTGDAAPLRGDAPVQLTPASWNCRYPAPAADALYLTCERGGRLDIYSLPPDGVVPAAWAEARILTALDHSTDPQVASLLLANLVQRQRQPEARSATFGALAVRALAGNDTALASWYAGRAAAEAGSGPGSAARSAAARALVALSAHRKELARVDAGARDEGFADRADKRLATLGEAESSTDGQAWLRLVRAEILDDLGREELALAQVQGLGAADTLGHDAILAVVLLGVPRLRALQAHTEADAWLLAAGEHRALRPAERLDVAERLVRQATRGRGVVARREAIERLRAKAAPDGELAMRLDVERALLALPPKSKRGPPVAATAGLGSAEEETVREQLFAIFRSWRELDRRRALVRATVARAAAVDSAWLLYQFANSYVSVIPRDHPGRAQAVDLFRQVVLERAWISWNTGQIRDARTNFYGVTLQTDDLEAWLGYVEAQHREGNRDVLGQVTKRFAKQPDHPALRTVHAWLRLRPLAEGGGGDADARREALEAADADLAVAQRGAPGDRHLHQLRGWVAHQRFLLGDGRGFAVQAHDRYRLALALADGDARIRGALLAALGLLQQAVGNHRIALDSFARRMALPFVDPEAELAVLVATARSQWHVGLADAALATLARAQAKLDATPTLARHRTLLLDRTALYAFESGDLARGRAASEALLARPELQRVAANRARAALVAAAAALASADGKATLAHLATADAALAKADEDALRAGRRPHQPPLEADRKRLLALRDGLRARAELLLGRPRDALPLLDRRIAALADADDESRGRLDRAAMLWHRGVARSLLGEHRAAMADLGVGLADADRFARATGTPAPPERIWLVRSAAELHLFAGAPLSALGRPLLPDLRAVYAALCQFGAPRWRPDRDALQLYLTLLDDGAGAPVAGRAAGRTTPATGG